MTYIAQRDALLAHAEAAALAANSKFTNVAAGSPVITGSKGCRLFYGGEGEAPEMPFQNAIDGSVLVGEVIRLVAWWAITGLSTTALAAVDDEMFTFKHELRNRVIADQTLGDEAVGLVLEPAEADIVSISGTRYALIGVGFLVGPTEYSPTWSPTP